MRKEYGDKINNKKYIEEIIFASIWWYMKIHHLLKRTIIVFQESIDILASSELQ